MDAMRILMDEHQSLAAIIHAIRHMIGEIGALGGGLIPSGMGISRQYTGTYLWGFVGIAACALAMLVLLRVMQIRWTRTWAEKGGRARSA